MNQMPSSPELRIALAQTNFRVGDITGNHQKILQIAHFANQNQVNLLIFPEMALSGYPIQDLIFDRDFFESEQSALEAIAHQFPEMAMVLGGFGMESDPNHHPRYQNNAFILYHGQIMKTISKRLTPTYDVFDEKRYFWSGDDYDPIELFGTRFGIAICEDLWDHDYQIDVAAKLVERGAECIISINGSPYYIHKHQDREALIAGKVQRFHVPIIYVNAIGGQDELVFDGRSFIMDSTGAIRVRGPFCQEAFLLCDYHPTTHQFTWLSFDGSSSGSSSSLPLPLPSHAISPFTNINAEIVDALSMNLRDYFQKTGVFDRIVLGLSGGVDSAFTAYIACQAIGAENVVAVLMPSRFSSHGSIADSIQLCDNLGMTYHQIAIKESHDQMLQHLDAALTSECAPSNLDLAQQNIQSRIRGLYLMYYSNKYNALVVSTGNKSELATGYCTLYGDTNGGKNVPGDLYKTQLYAVCRWINRDREIIPTNIITKPPSAELKEDQIDEDNLPPYALLDEILSLRIDEGYSPREIIALGYEDELVRRIERLYVNAEFKRAQVAQTIKINKKTFGSGRKIPVLKRTTY